MSRRCLLTTLEFLTIVVFTGVIWAAASRRQPENTPLVFEAIPVAEKATLGKPVYVKFRLTNVSRENVLINRRFHLEETVLLEITSSSGQKVTWCGRIPQLAISSGDFVILGPRAHAERNVRVSCDEARISGFLFPGPGDYLVRARYELPFPTKVLKEAAGAAMVLKGPFEAHPVHVVIAAPQ